MKITIVQGAFLPVPPLMGGAVEKQWHGLGREMARRGHEVVHLSRMHPDLPQQGTIDGVKHVRVPGFDYPSSLLKIKMLDLIYTLRVRKHLPPADILVSNTFWLPVFVRDRSRGGICVQVARFPRGQMKYYAHCARLHAVSAAIYKAILEQTPQVKPITKVLSNFLGDGWIEPVPDLSLPREPVVLYVGRVHPEKGIGLLIDAFAKAAPTSWRLEIVGPSEVVTGGGGPDYMAELKGKAAAIADRVVFVGPIFDHAELVKRYERASIFAYPSLAEMGESFGLSPLEGMARGTPAIVSGLDCFGEYLRPDINGVRFDHRAADPVEALATKLRAMIEGWPGLLPMREAGLQTAAEFTVPKAADRYLADFEDVVAGRPAA